MVLRNNTKSLQPCSVESKNILIDFIKSKIPKCNLPDDSFNSVLDNKITGFCTSLNKKWTLSNRTFNVFSKKNEDWLNLHFEF